MARFDLNRIDAAVDQLDWAIRLFIDHSAFAAAITLAGAAEEILGRAAASRSAFEQLKTKFSNDFSYQKRSFRRITSIELEIGLNIGMALLTTKRSRWSSMRKRFNIFSEH